MSRLLEMIMVSTGGMTAGGVMLRLTLAILSMFATVHLLSLWGTRYGDHNTTSKSFFLSLVLHACFGLGWVTVADSYPHRSVGSEPETLQTPITFIDAEDVAPETGTNKLPVFHAGPATNDGSISRDRQDLTRIDRDESIEDLQSPSIDKGPQTNVAPDLPEFTAETEEQAPGLESSAASPPASAASSPLMIDEPTIEARPEVVAMPAARTTISRSAASTEPISRPAFQRGPSSKATPFQEDGTSMMLPSDYNMDALPRPQENPSTEVVRRVGSPNPASVVETETESSNPVANSGSRRPDRITTPTNRTTEYRDEIRSRPSVASIPSSIGRSVDDRMLNSRGPSESIDESPQPAFIRPSLPTMSRAPTRAAETYQARTLGQRMASVLKHGGSEESERAVENSLKWMASVQELDGHWSASRHGGGLVKHDPQGQDRQGGGKFADSGVTGLVVLSFLGAGYTDEKGPYTTEVRKAIDWLIFQQSNNGYLGGKATRFDQNYCHAIATFALAEAFAMQKEAGDYPELKNAVKKGVKLIAAFQNDDGGWRYGRGGESSESDMSMFGWQLMALKSAVNGGIPVPEETRRGMVKFLEARGRGNHGGLAGYRTVDKPTPAMTAEALFCRQMFAVTTMDAAREEAADYLRKNLPKITSYDEYYWYYGTLAMHHLDDEAWQEWNGALRDLLISLQRQDGPLAGSWDPKGKWAGIGGRLYSTALSTMCLEVYYRYTSIAKPDSPIP